MAERIGITQILLSDYERGKLRLNADMIVRFANALDVTDDLLQPKGTRTPLRPPRTTPQGEDRETTAPSAELPAEDHRRILKGSR